MVVSHFNIQIRLFASLPYPVQTAIVAYANAANRSPSAVIEYALSDFLELDAEVGNDSRQTFDEGSILAELPASLQAAIAQYGIENEMPPEFVVELAIAHFLDPDAVTFDDCQLAVQRDQIERLQHDQKLQAATAA